MGNPGASDNKPAPPLRPGDPIPWFSLPGNSSPDFKIHSVAGFYVVLCFFGTAADPGRLARLKGLLAHRKLFDDKKLMLFAVATDDAKQPAGTYRDGLPGVRFFFDRDEALSRRFRPEDGAGVTYVLDPTLRVLAAVRFDEPAGHDALLGAILTDLPPQDGHANTPLTAPALLVPRILEPDLCRALIETYQSGQGEDSGFMREKDGKTVAMVDHV